MYKPLTLLFFVLAWEFLKVLYSTKKIPTQGLDTQIRQQTVNIVYLCHAGTVGYFGGFSVISSISGVKL